MAKTMNHYEINHPILMEKLCLLMDPNTESPEFRRLMREISFALTYEALRDWPTEEKNISTPNGPDTIPKLINYPAVISILRAGNGMIDGVTEALPLAPLGHIGIYRDRDLDSTVEYFFRLPQKIKGNSTLLLDPIIATGDTVCASVSRLKEFGVEDIRVLTILASKPGLEKLNKINENVSVWGLRLNESLNESGHLAPGPGDVSARLCNTT
ncbi:MAG: uracil phosphoribosyltransferase [Rhodospirillaceae bacterium]|nr:uracil phosphoribosyltransferase [Rhodospirillaceae bacterium]